MRHAAYRFFKLANLEKRRESVPLANQSPLAELMTAFAAANAGPLADRPSRDRPRSPKPEERAPGMGDAFKPERFDRFATNVPDGLSIESVA
jgi:hypothetical protein